MSDTQTLIDNRPPSVAALFIDRVAATPNGEAYRYPVPSASGSGPDDWKSLSWGQASERVFAIAAGLIALGVRPEERVALSSATRVEWVLIDLGVMCAGAATTTIYPSTNAEESAFILADSESRILIAENAEQLAKARETREGLPELAHVVVIDPAGCRACRGRPRGLDHHPRRAGGPGRRAPRQDPGRGHRAGLRDHRRPARHPHLHLGYHRPPQGRAAAARQLVVHGQGHGGDRADHGGGRAVPLAAARPRLRQGPHLRADRGRPRHRDRRPHRQDHREPADRPADLHGRRAPDLREGLQRGRVQGPRGRRRQVQDLPVGGRGRPRVREGLPGQLPPHRQGLRPLRARRQAQGRRRARLLQDP